MNIFDLPIFFTTLVISQQKQSAMLAFQTVIQLLNSRNRRPCFKILYSLYLYNFFLYLLYFIVLIGIKKNRLR